MQVYDIPVPYSTQVEATMAPTKSRSPIEVSSPFLREVPQEVRIEIYRELLLMSRTTMLNGHPRSFLEILRVNKQIHEEASRVFYDENEWVMLTFDFPGHASRLNYDKNRTYKIARDVFRLGELPFGRDPGIEIGIHSGKEHEGLQLSTRHARCKNPKHYMITRLVDAGPLFRSFLHVFSREEIEDFEYVITFARYTLRPQFYETIRDYLADIRGVSKATVVGGEPRSVVADIARVMMTPVSDVAEIHARGGTSI